MTSRENNPTAIHPWSRREECRWHANAEWPVCSNSKLSKQRYLTLEHAMASFVVSQQSKSLQYTNPRPLLLATQSRQLAIWLGNLNLVL